MATIVLLGDFCPVAGQEAPFRAGGAATLAGKFAGRLQAADAVVANLEGPLAAGDSPADKYGPALRLHPGVLTGARDLGVRAFGLANNHVMDQGVAGLEQTLAGLDAAGMGHFGAGRDAREARRSLFLDLPDCRVGLHAVCANEFGVANEGRPGVNGLEPLALWEDMDRLRQACDVPIVLVHAGAEGFPYPSPANLSLGRLLCRYGARVVVFQHSHVVGCEDPGATGVVLHGQGNFIQPLAGRTRNRWHLGCALELSLSGREACTRSLHFFEQSWSGPGLRPLSDEEEIRERAGFQERSLVAGAPDQLERRWRDYCLERGREIHQRMLSTSRWPLRLVRRLRLDRLWPGRRGARFHENIFRCEDHREVLATYFSLLRRREA